MRRTILVPLPVVILLGLLIILIWGWKPGADWFTAIATIALAVAAFYTIVRDELQTWFRRPEFGIVFFPRSP